MVLPLTRCQAAFKTKVRWGQSNQSCKAPIFNKKRSPAIGFPRFSIFGLFFLFSFWDLSICSLVSGRRSRNLFLAGRLDCTTKGQILVGAVRSRLILVLNLHNAKVTVSYCHHWVVLRPCFYSLSLHPLLVFTLWSTLCLFLFFSLSLFVSLCRYSIFPSHALSFYRYVSLSGSTSLSLISQSMLRM